MKHVLLNSMLIRTISKVVKIEIPDSGYNFYWSNVPPK
jgi:hypothetical protein